MALIVTLTVRGLILIEIHFWLDTVPPSSYSLIQANVLLCFPTVKALFVAYLQLIVSTLILPPRCLQDQGDVVQPGLINNVTESRDPNLTFTDVFMAVEVAAQFT